MESCEVTSNLFLLVALFIHIYFSGRELTSFLGFASPILLQQLLRSIENQKNQASITYAILIVTLRLVKAQSGVFSLWFCRRCYERSRGEMITMIYEKTLQRKAFTLGIETKDDNSPEQEDNTKNTTWTNKLWSNLQAVRKFFISSPKPKPSPATMGKILNLMKNDVYEVAQRFWEFQSIVTVPLNLIVAVLLVWQLLGWSCLLGVLCVFLAQLLNVAFVSILLKLEKIRRAATDLRLQVSSQFIESIRHLRWYDWQESWLQRITEARSNELYQRVIVGLWSNAIGATSQLANALFPVVAFFAYTVIANEPLRVDVAFPALQLFLMLDYAIRRLPGLITVLLNASVALGRIEDFMAEPEIEESLRSHSRELSFNFKHASFAWPGAEDEILKDVNLSIPVGFTVVSGRVGQGKTALLQAALGELERRAGEIFLPNEMVGYCNQSPWLQSMSIRENILFSSPYDERRYKQTLEACALVPDLASFAHGDLSNIGENGIGLSGGQKARVALARAVYSRANILLLDDPLAALDHDTATYIVRKLFQGPLVQGRIVVLVTHRIDLVSSLADQILEVHQGKVIRLDDKAPKQEIRAKSLDSEGDVSQREDQKDVVPDKFIEEEHRATGGVLASVYWTYIKSGDLRWWALLIVAIVVQRIFRVADYYFLKEWGEAYERVQASGIFTDIFNRFPSPDVDVRPWLLAYLGIAIAKTISNIFIDLILLIIIYVSGKYLFKDVLTRVSQATFRFYDTTPVGRLMNRLTSDFGTLDGGIGRMLQEFAWCLISWTTAMIVIASTTPSFLIFSLTLTAVFIYIFFQFLPTSQSLRRLEMVSLTPLMTNFGILLEGLTTVRAFRAQPQFQDRIISVTDEFQKMDHFYWSLQAWLMFRLDILSAFSTFCMTLLALYDNLSPGLTAFILTTASGFVQNTHALCRYYGQLQMDFVSVERIIELLQLDQEHVGDIEPPAAWPSYKDDIVFNNVTIKYAPHLPPALENTTFQIPGGSTTAIIGRTGSGKSTMALAMLATIRPEPDGKIQIGSIDLSKVDVHILRQRVTFVAQDPVLFPGTLRQNLDPINAYSDEECAGVLSRIFATTTSGTESSINALSSPPEFTLETQIATGGKNLSQGQRQLIGLGRAILRRSPVIILDEATASIDSTTAIEVQRVLREELKESTVIMIAHRVEAVRAANWAIVLDKGKVAQVGPAEEVVAQRFEIED
jgi:ABC-type multidrug transport system fused ATPase/permease subunit